jgi:molecular chaperone GrpE
MNEEYQHAGSGWDTAEFAGTARQRDGTGAGQGRPAGAGSFPAATASPPGSTDRPDERPVTVEGAVQRRLAEETARREDTEQRMVRMQADYSNYKRRTEQEREQRERLSNLALVRELLPVLDSLDRAVAAVPEAVSGLPWMDGLLLVDRQLRATLEKQGLTPIVAVGTRFDPTVHEAILQELTSEYDDDTVIAELQRGYMLHDALVRPTLVKVAKHVQSAARTARER